MIVSTPPATALVAWCASSFATRVTRAIGESPRDVDFLVFPALLLPLVLLLVRLLALFPRLALADLPPDRFDSAGPLPVDRALADLVVDVDLRAGALVPARVFFVLLRDLEDFFARAAMTVSSREWAIHLCHRKNWTHR